MTASRRPGVALAVIGAAIAALLVLAGCPESQNRPHTRRPTKIHKKAPVIKKSLAPHHEHPHEHPHAESDHHHHPHPHPHLGGPNGHHHPY